jgi:hypothetical protein
VARSDHLDRREPPEAARRRATAVAESTERSARILATAAVAQTAVPFSLAMKHPAVPPPTICVLAATLWVMFASATAAAQADAPRPPASQPASDSQNPINPDRPGIADGSGVIARGQLQIEFGFQREFRQEAVTKARTSFLPALIRVGIDGRWEGRVETNAYTWIETQDPTGTSHVSGWSPASLGVKYLICDSNDARRPSLGTIVRAFPASGSGDLASRRLTGDVRLAADLDLSRTLSLNPNVGIGRYEGDNGETFTATLLALTLSYQPSDRVSPFVDIGYQRPVDVGGPASLLVDAGFAYIIGQRVQLDVSLGTGAHGPAPRPFLSFGISLRSGR